MSNFLPIGAKFLSFDIVFPRRAAVNFNIVRMRIFAGDQEWSKGERRLAA
jgi:hypothetical protein